MIRLAFLNISKLSLGENKAVLLNEDGLYFPAYLFVFFFYYLLVLLDNETGKTNLYFIVHVSRHFTGL